MVFSGLPLERLGEQHLMLRGDPVDPGDHTDVVDPLRPLGLGHCREVGAENRLAGDADLLCDRGAGGDVIAGYHPQTRMCPACA